MLDECNQRNRIRGDWWDGRMWRVGAWVSAWGRGWAGGCVGELATGWVDG